MRIIYKEPGKPPVERDVPNELHALQELVGGQMETVRITQQVLAIVNEEGIPRACRTTADSTDGLTRRASTGRCFSSARRARTFATCRTTLRSTWQWR